MNTGIINLAHGSGGREMLELIHSFDFTHRGQWENCDDDSASLDIENNNKLVFTTDSFVVDPIFFPGGNIGHLAVCGTINDLAVMGARPLGLSLGLVIEEGFSKQDLAVIIRSVIRISEETGIPVVTGDTKVMENGKIDKIIINTSGVGIAKSEELLTRDIVTGDKIILSGGIGEHAVALLSKKFDYETDIITDCKPLIHEISAVKDLIKLAKDPTRGGIAAVLNELCEKHCISFLLDEEAIPVKHQVRKITRMLGIEVYELACEGRFVCIASQEEAGLVESRLQEFNTDAAIIGEVVHDEGNRVILQTLLGKRILPVPSGRIVPRIC
ncbi:MAG: hydrogenase expression/formation protein HypE [Methanosarcinales archaeon]|nr:hydrogenase expression/formation protein HypE [Methanosarcinales archaeon]